MGSLVKLFQRIISGFIEAVRITTIQEELFVLGKAFSYEDYISFSAGETKTIVFDPTAFAGIQIAFNPISFSATSGPIKIDFYTGSDSDDDGTILEPSNRREGFPGPASILRLNPNNITLGDRFAGDLVPANGLGVGNANGGNNQPGLPFEIDFTLKKAITIKNEDGADTLVQLKITWFEV